MECRQAWPAFAGQALPLFVVRKDLFIEPQRAKAGNAWLSWRGHRPRDDKGKL